MITRETRISTNGFDIKFAVYDNGEWLVSINNNELEIGATGMPCNGNWNKGLASAVDNIADMLTENELGDLFNGLKKNENIDNVFMDYIEGNYDKCRWCGYRDFCEHPYDPCE